MIVSYMVLWLWFMVLDGIANNGLLAFSQQKDRG
jgi:hypothetical protein